jgi:hypothetical protein
MQLCKLPQSCLGSYVHKLFKALKLRVPTSLITCALILKRDTVPITCRCQCTPRQTMGGTLSALCSVTPCDTTPSTVCTMMTHQSTYVRLFLRFRPIWWWLVIRFTYTSHTPPYGALAVRFSPSPPMELKA